MDGKHPKRRKDKYNPYTIREIRGRYYLAFKDGEGVRRSMEIEKALFDTLNQFELDDLTFMNEVDRHYEQSVQFNTSLNRRALHPQEPVEETVARRMESVELHQAISQLPDVQRRRLILYYFGELTYQQIAEMEGCTKRAVKFSVDLAIAKLKEIL